jgi:hypothetical protein
MSGRYLAVGCLERRLWTGTVESIRFNEGVNLLVGVPNTGKTQWLKFLDFILGDSDSFEGRFDESIVEKYEAASAELFVAGERLLIERRWRQSGLRSKVIVNEEALDPAAFQQLLMVKLGIPILHYPKGNPQSGQTWPELSLRSLLRHIHRQQRFWGDLADKQPEGEQLACLLLFGGVAEHVYTDEYGNLVDLTLEARRLRQRLEQYGWTLNALAKDLLDEGDALSRGVTRESVAAADADVSRQILALREERSRIIESGMRSGASVQASRIAVLSQDRAKLLADREAGDLLGRETSDRLGEMKRYRDSLLEELERLARAHDAGEVLADLRITHCPACDQALKARYIEASHCHLCHQNLPDEPALAELGDARLSFEQDRLRGEVKEASDLVGLLERDVTNQRKDWIRRAEAIRQIENELAPARAAVAALVQEAVSAVDVAMGKLSERQRQIGRLRTALATGEELKRQVTEIEEKIEPLQRIVNETQRQADFERAADLLADGMNAYLARIDELKPGTWKHQDVSVTFSARSFDIRVGSRLWSTILGGSDTLYFLMAYHYGLLSLSDKSGLHYPGLSIIDLPGDFLGESVEDKENFIVQPFIDLLESEAFEGAQVIITGAAFRGLSNVHRQTLDEIYVGD